MNASTERNSNESKPLETTQASLQAKENSYAVEPPEPMAPGDEVPPGTPGSAEGLCPGCGGSGREADKSTPCAVCEGTGKVQVGVGGG
jgi:hypothetical protein